MALLLLRVALAAFLTGQGVVLMLNISALSFRMWLLSAVLLLAGLALLMGYLTRPAGILAAVVYLANALFPPSAMISDLFEGRIAYTFAAVIGLALLGTGPGAFSVDARLFGRREIVIPLSGPAANKK